MRVVVRSTGFIAGAATLAVLLASRGAHAQAVDSRGLTYDARVDVPVTAGALLFLAGSEMLKDVFTPASCRFCDQNPDGSDGLDRPDATARAALRWNHADRADDASDVTGFVLEPIAALELGGIAAAADHRSSEVAANTLVVLEATLLAADLAQGIKFLVARQRPFAHFRNPPSIRRHDPEEVLSFYSGHTSLAFSLAVASGTVASMRGYRLAPAVWASSIAFAAVTGYLRIAADKHYLTDVVAGAVIGSAIGFLVPFVFHHGTAPDEGSSTVSLPTTAMASRPLFLGSWTF